MLPGGLARVLTDGRYKLPIFYEKSANIVLTLIPKVDYSRMKTLITIYNLIAEGERRAVLT